MQSKIERSRPLRELVRSARRNRNELVRTLYLTVLSRYPTESEQAEAVAHLRSVGASRPEAVHDLVWALINHEGVSVAGIDAA